VWGGGCWLGGGGGGTLRPMTQLTAAITVRNLEQALSAAARAAELGADLVEFRIDTFTDDPHAITELVQRSALPCIITCRPTWEGGAYDGDEQTRISLLEHAGLGPRKPVYIDLELLAWRKSANLRQKISLVVDDPDRPRQTDTGLVLSSHDFSGRPSDLLRKVRDMADAPLCRVVKVAWQARSLRDNLEAFELIRQQVKPTIALCMGEYGLASRVLAKKFGALLTFASIDGETGTAPGQPTLSEIKGLYRWDRLDAGTRVFGVIGFPVGHSMSPPVHNAGFDAAGVNGVYLPMPIPPQYEHFKATVSSWLAMPGLHFGGASVTIPHKENLLRFVEERGGEIEPLAERIGAANTLQVREDGSLYACNTDYAAALDAVCDGLKIERAGLEGKRVAVVGAGGAARAVVAGFAHYGALVTVYNRTVQRAEALAEQFGADAAPLADLSTSRADVYINCTPIGMHPQVDASPFDVDQIINHQPQIINPFGPGVVVFDTIYNPVRTNLLRAAADAGCATIPGTEMFVRQAAAQFKLWTGKGAPLGVFRDVLMEHLSASGA
jgi:3-dehydroquinate dehydratase / shikimate dehydrogenase